MHILLMGGTGFIGTALVPLLLQEGHAVTLTTRRRHAPALSAKNPNVTYAFWDQDHEEQNQDKHKAQKNLVPLLEGVDAVINLQGENIAAKRWSTARKKALVQSRTHAGNALSYALQTLHSQGKPLPHTLIQASACGYYGAWADTATAPLCDETSPQGTGFLATTCGQWEAATNLVEDLGLRRCIVRLAPVLGAFQNGKPGGMLAAMVPVFKSFLGGAAGTGRQPFAWIHIDDTVNAILFLLQGKQSGVFNLCAPQQEPPLTAKDMAHALGHVLHRPAFFPAPAAVLRLVLGQMADELLLQGQRPTPTALFKAGFAFRYCSLSAALAAILSKKQT